LAREVGERGWVARVRWSEIGWERIKIRKIEEKLRKKSPNILQFIQIMFIL
jgi:hypothetical protein